MQMKTGEVLITNQFIDQLHVEKINRDIKNMKIFIVKKAKEKLLTPNSPKKGKSSKVENGLK